MRACKRFIYVENLLNEVPKPSRPRQKPAAHASSATPEQASELASDQITEQTAAAQDDEAPAELEDPQKLVLRAMDAISQEDEWFSLGQIGQYITAASPDFDTRSYGKRKLSDLIATMKILETRRGEGNQIVVRRLD